MLRNENGLLNGYVYVDVAGRDVSSYVEESRQVVAAQVDLPTGYAIEWSGQYEAMQRVKARLKVVIPLTLLLVVGLLYMNTRSVGRTTIIVAHRLSTIRSADRIAVLDDGWLVELGTQDELLARDGLYARLHRVPFEVDPVPDPVEV